MHSLRMKAWNRMTTWIEFKILEATLQRRKAVGNDGIIPGIIRKLGSQGMKILQHHFDLAWKAKISDK